MAAFSVLLSVYGKENPLFLQESLKSILMQTRKPDEFVIVKDGPLTEALENVISDFLNECGSITKIISLPENKGLGVALQKGVLECTCGFIARMDTDDIAHPDRFEKQMEYLEKHPDISLLGSWIQEFSTDAAHPDTYTRLPCTHEEIARYAKKRNPFRHMTVILKKSAVLESGNYRNFLWFEDYDLWVRLLQHNFKAANLPEYLVSVRADRKMFARRGGLSYFKQEFKFQTFLYESGFISAFSYVKNLLIRGMVRILPNSLRSAIYMNFLRKSEK